MNITVYLGANFGNDPKLKIACEELGTWIGKSGNNLVYGGSKSGLMGVLAENVLKNGGEVIGVEPQFFIDQGLEYKEITKLYITCNRNFNYCRIYEKERSNKTRRFKIRYIIKN